MVIYAIITSSVYFIFKYIFDVNFTAIEKSINLYYISIDIFIGGSIGFYLYTIKSMNIILVISIILTVYLFNEFIYKKIVNRNKIKRIKNKESLIGKSGFAKNRIESNQFRRNIYFNK
jgi:uncharacterized membrane protein